MVRDKAFVRAWVNLSLVLRQGQIQKWQALICMTRIPTLVYENYIYHPLFLCICQTRRGKVTSLCCNTSMMQKSVWMEHLFLIITTKENGEVDLCQRLRTVRVSVGLNSTAGENNGGLRLSKKAKCCCSYRAANCTSVMCCLGDDFANNDDDRCYAQKLPDGVKSCALRKKKWRRLKTQY